MSKRGRYLSEQGTEPVHLMATGWEGRTPIRIDAGRRLAKLAVHVYHDVGTRVKRRDV